MLFCTSFTHRQGRSKLIEGANEGKLDEAWRTRLVRFQNPWMDLAAHRCSSQAKTCWPAALLQAAQASSGFIAVNKWPSSKPNWLKILMQCCLLSVNFVRWWSSHFFFWDGLANFNVQLHVYSSAHEQAWLTIKWLGQNLTSPTYCYSHNRYLLQ